MNTRPSDTVVRKDNSRAQRKLARQPHTAVDLLAERIPALCDSTGALPPQAVLAQELGVSRPMLREAVSQLVACGVLDVRTRVGTRVVDEHRWQIVNRRVVGWRLARATALDFIADIAQIRRVLEPIAAADAAGRASPENRSRITTACAARLVATSLRDYAAARRELHVAILAASSNQFIRQLTCLVPLLDPAVDQNADAPVIPDGERHALARFEAAIRLGDMNGAHEGIERLNTWDLPRTGGHADV